MSIADMAQSIMPPLYTALWPTLAAIVALRIVYRRLRLQMPRAVEIGLDVILTLVGMVTFALSLTTGANPVLSLETYRPAVVGVRGAMFFTAGGTLHALALGLLAYRRAHRLAVAARHPKREQGEDEQGED